MDNIHLWQYIVIAGPAAVLGGLAVWAFNREYVRGLEDVVIGEPSRVPQIVIPAGWIVEAAKHKLPDCQVARMMPGLHKSLLDIYNHGNQVQGDANYWRDLLMSLMKELRDCPAALLRTGEKQEAQS